jgi:hypothetical protein
MFDERFVSAFCMQSWRWMQSVANRSPRNFTANREKYREIRKFDAGMDCAAGTDDAVILSGIPVFDLALVRDRHGFKPAMKIPANS